MPEKFFESLETIAQFFSASAEKRKVSQSENNNSIFDTLIFS